MNKISTWISYQTGSLLTSLSLPDHKFLQQTQ